MKYNALDITGTVVKNDERYTIIDNNDLDKLTVSTTRLYPGKSTVGHDHPGAEEIYHFVYGKGKMEIDNETFDVVTGDYVLVKDGAFHRVHNTGIETLYFIRVHNKEQ